jgi:hypothetical protein
MTALQILSILLPYQKYLFQLQQVEMNRAPAYEWTYSVSLNYQMIHLKIYQKSDSNRYKQLHTQITFKIEKDIVSFESFFCENNIDTETIINAIKSDSNLHGPAFIIDSDYIHTFSDELIESLSIADRISQHAVNRNMGDSYWPGNYSIIDILPTSIMLTQVNHMNSRSLNHKNDYTLRNLIFTIPLEQNEKIEARFGDVTIGNMLVNFSDRSSENNRGTGNDIMEEMRKEL